MRSLTLIFVFASCGIVMLPPFFEKNLRAETLYFHNGEKIEAAVDFISKNKIIVDADGDLRIYSKSQIKRIEYDCPKCIRVFIKLKDGNLFEADEVSFSYDSVQTYKKNKKDLLYSKNEILEIYYEKIELPKDSLRNCFYKSLIFPGLGQYCQCRNAAGDIFLYSSIALILGLVYGAYDFIQAQANFDEVTPEDVMFRRIIDDPFASPEMKNEERRKAALRFKAKRDRLTGASARLTIIMALSFLLYAYNLFDAWYYYPLRRENNIDFNTPFIKTARRQVEKNKRADFYFTVGPEANLLSSFSKKPPSSMAEEDLFSLRKVKFGYSLFY